eukprot:4995579-Amphidinium_carterae.1
MLDFRDASVHVFHGGSALGSDATFFVLGAICCVSASFVACYLPETRGKTAEAVMMEMSQRGRRWTTVC